MYEDNEKRINWALILKRILMVVLALLLIFAFIALVQKCARDEDKNKVLTPVDLTEQLELMQNATLKYITKDNLPTDLNSSKTIKLKYLINKNLIEEIKDSEGNTCSENSSYAEITKLENNYAVKLNLNCGQNSDYKIVYIGCFESCQDGEVCLGDENSTGGICGEVNKEETKENDKQTNTPVKKPNTSNNTNVKPSTNTPSNTNKPTNNKPQNNTINNNQQNSNNTNNSNNTVKTRTLYEFERCTQKYICDTGTLTLDRNCVQYKNRTLYGNVIDKQSKVAAIVKSTDTTEYYNTTSVQNTSYKFVTYRIENKYTFKGYVTGKGYQFVRTQTIYSCNSGSIDGNYCVTTTKGCADSSYTYSNGACIKRITEPYYTNSRLEKTCNTTWSYSTSLAGWTRTGRTKQEKVSN